VPNAELRERYNALIDGGLRTASEIAYATGYTFQRAGGQQADIQRLKKQLGIIDQVGGPDPVTGVRPRVVVKSVNYDTAVLLCKAMGVEYPSEVGV
jgi:hypothetical protein